jgi:hypothetical protein
MHRRCLLHAGFVVLAFAALDVSLIPAADAKVGARLRFAPSPPAAQRAVRVIVRTNVALSMSESLTLVAVGPWKGGYGQAVRYAHLRRTGKLAYAAAIRFPYPGRWRVQVTSASGAVLIARHADVRRKTGS